MEAKISARGNGLPDVGDYVAGNDGEVYVVVSFRGPVRASQSGSGAGDYIYGDVELADWSDVDEDNEPTCSCTLEVVARTAEAWWSWHDADNDRVSASVSDAEARCAAWVAGESTDGPEVVR